MFVPPYPADMNEAGAVGVLAGLAAAVGFVLTILGTVLWLIDRRFDEPPEQSAGRKLMRLGLMVMLVGGLVLVAIALAS
jgi:uncharacterized iron-regulated membrane protein